MRRRDSQAQLKQLRKTLSRRHSRLKVDDESAVRRTAATAERHDINTDLLAFIKA
jgi:hypothetical protein